MQYFYAFSAFYLMPIYAIILFYCLISIAKSIKNDKPTGAEGIVGAIVFAMILWTISGSLLLDS